MFLILKYLMEFEQNIINTTESSIVDCGHCVYKIV